MSTTALAPAAEAHRELLDQLLADVAEYAPDADSGRVAAAFEMACVLHDGQLRKSGEPFVYHSWNVAKICAQLRQPENVLIGALLHDVVEDTAATADEIEERFGAEVRVLVEGVTKLSKIQFASREEAEAENYRKMILSMSADIRVVVNSDGSVIAASYCHSSPLSARPWRISIAAVPSKGMATAGGSKACDSQQARFPSSRPMSPTWQVVPPAQTSSEPPGSSSWTVTSCRPRPASWTSSDER